MTPHDLSHHLQQEAHFGPVVLLADDSKTMRLVTMRALEREGLQTVCVAAPLEAIAAAGEYRPDLFLLDITFAAGALTDGYTCAARCATCPSFMRRRFCS